ncbi:MurR/RpiR family transcriptional regulator [Paracoccus denitrificans]|uniref:MurR/RpiR family transcriptional regulator n=1 Tax=Paracoccus denitrificans TaxID=266 RepID=UPI001F1EF914|nr:MurR/RpiR family transcriptional regulator [Paracoccus denitrificans]
MAEGAGIKRFVLASSPSIHADGTDRPDVAGKARDLFSERYERRRDRLSPAFQRVAGYIDANRLAVLTSSAIEIARAAGTSDATVIRTVQALGFAGLQELRRELAAGLGQRTTPADNLKRTLDDAEEQIDAAVENLLDVYAAGLEVLRSAGFRENLMKALSALNDARRIFVFGIGPTAHIAAYFAARLRRKGRQQQVIDRTGAGLADQLLELAPGDAVVMLAYGSLYKEANATLAEARRLRLPVILISDSAQSELSSRAQVVLAVPRGRNDRFALHGVTVFCLEMLLLGLAAGDSEKALAALADLERLRQVLRSGRKIMSADSEDE